MSLFFRSQKQDELILMFNIGSSFVGGTLFRSSSEGVPKILFSIKEQIVLEPKIDAERFLFLTLQSLETVANKIHKKALGAPSKIFCVLSSPWYVSETRVVRLEKNAPFIFTQKIADELIQKEITLFKEQHAKDFLNTNDGLRIIELKNIKTMLNGYETVSPFGHKAKDIEITIFLSISGEKLLKKFEETIAKSFSFRNINFVSLLISSFLVVRDLPKHKNNFLLIDISGEVTEISMIKNNILCESISFPMGCNFIVRGLAENLNCSLWEADSLLSLFKEGHTGTKVAKKMEPIVHNLKIEWQRQFQESLANISRDISVPSMIYMALDRDLVDFFSDTIKSEQFNQYTLAESKFEVVYLGTEILNGLATFTDDAIRDPNSIMNSVYVNYLLKEQK